MIPIRCWGVCLLVLAGLVAGLGWPCPKAYAQDRFEIQVYDAETAPKGGAGVEVHFNVVAVGSHSVAADGELPTHHVTHLTLEPHLGLSRWCELGAYIQTAMREDGTLDYAGIKLRLKSRIPRRLAHNLIGLALNIEFSVIPATYESNVWGSELRPVFDIQWRRLYFSLNPILSTDLGGSLIGRPQLQPAAKFAVSIIPMLALGVEYYAAFGPLDSPYGIADQMHRLLGVVDIVHKLTDKMNFDVNLGAGYNFGAGDPWVVKAIFGIGR